MNNTKLGFIGVGNMGGSILDGILSNGVLPRENLIICDIDKNVLSRHEGKGVGMANNAVELSRSADLILLCVKPNSVEAVLKQLDGVIDGKALLSIAAGVNFDRLRELTNSKCRLLRIMPNTPAMVGLGATVLCSDTTLTEEEKQFSAKIFEAIGIVEWLPEYLIDVVTGLSGGGPAYASMFIEAMADGAVLQGLPRATAYRLAAQTVMGTAKMVLNTNLHPGILKDMVCSPGGTTIEGVKALEDGGMRASVINAINESAIKARSL